MWWYVGNFSEKLATINMEFWKRLARVFVLNVLKYRWYRVWNWIRTIRVVGRNSENSRSTANVRRLMSDEHDTKHDGKQRTERHVQKKIDYNYCIIFIVFDHHRAGNDGHFYHRETREQCQNFFATAWLGLPRGFYEPGANILMGPRLIDTTFERVTGLFKQNWHQSSIMNCLVSLVC